MEKGGAKLKRKDSDEWLCSSTYRPNRSEILEKEGSSERKTKKLKVVVPKRVRRTPSEAPSGRPLSFKNEYEVECQETRTPSETSRSSGIEIQKTFTPSRRLSKLKIISPAIPRNVSLRASPPVLQNRKSPEQVFASLTPKRRNSLEVVLPALKRRKEDPFADEDEGSDDENSDCSEVSNVFDYFSPVKQSSPKDTDALNSEYSPPKTKFSLNFITGYEAQFTTFEETQPSPVDDKRESPDLFHEDPMSILEEESELQMAEEFGIEVSPEKRKCVKFKETQEKNAKRTLRFSDPEEPSLWRKEHNIEESCGLFLHNSAFQEYAIDVETQAVPEESACLPDEAETQKYAEAESCALLNHPLSDSPESLQNDEIYERDELAGLSGTRFRPFSPQKSLFDIIPIPPFWLL